MFTKTLLFMNGESGKVSLLFLPGRFSQYIVYLVTNKVHALMTTFDLFWLLSTASRELFLLQMLQNLAWNDTSKPIS